MSLKRQSRVIGPRRPALLLLDSDRPYAAALARHLRSRNFKVTAAHTARRAYKVVLSTGIDYAVIDPKLEEDNGLSFLAALRQRQPRCRVIVLTSYASIETAVVAMKLGARDYLIKPTTPEHVKCALLGDDTPVSPVVSPDDVKIQHVLSVFRLCDGNVTRTAKHLKMHRRTLQRILSRVKSDSGLA